MKGSVKWWLGLAVPVSLLMASITSACDAKGKEIIGARAAKIAVYTEAGKYSEEIDGDSVLKKTVLACSPFNASLASVQVTADSEPIWIKLTEVKLNEPPCPEPIAATQGKAIDAMSVASSGAGSCRK